LGAGPIIGLDRLLAKNGPDLSQYATLSKPINLLKFADTSISDFFPNSKEFFFSEFPGNVGGWSPDRPGSIIRQK
jgi:hypothetical protein